MIKFQKLQGINENNKILPSNTDLAYIAGMIDAEGCILIKKDIRNKRFTYKPCITIQMKDIEPLKFISLRFPKKINYYSKRDVYSLRYQIKDAEILGKAILPYLRIKKEQMEQMLLLQSCKMDNPTGKIINNRDFFESITQKIKNLKRIYPEISFKNITEKTPENLAYIAGLIEGDGSIGIYNQVYRGYNPLITLTITMNDGRGIELINSCFPHKITKRKCGAYNLTYRSSKAIEILENIYPYLSFKNKQADCCFEFIKTHDFDEQQRLIDKCSKHKVDNWIIYKPLPDLTWTKEEVQRAIDKSKLIPKNISKKIKTEKQEIFEQNINPKNLYYNPEKQTKTLSKIIQTFFSLKDFWKNCDPNKVCYWTKIREWGDSYYNLEQVIGKDIKLEDYKIKWNLFLKNPSDKITIDNIKIELKIS